MRERDTRSLSTYANRTAEIMQSCEPNGPRGKIGKQQTKAEECKPNPGTNT